MNDFKFLPDDPKLTAYALGELEGEERAAVEAALPDDPAARAAVEEIRATAGRLQAALVSEAAGEEKAAVASPAAQRAAIIAGRDRYKLDGGPLQKAIRFPQFYFVAAGLAAACFALVVALRTPSPHPAPAQKVYTQVDLTPAPTVAPVDLPTVSEPAAEVDRAAETKVALAPAAPMTANPSEPKPSVDTGVAVASQPLLDQVKNERAVAVQNGPGLGGAPFQATEVSLETRAKDAAQRVAAANLADRSDRKLVSLKQTKTAGATAAAPAANAGTGDVVALSPFAVSASNNAAFAASGTLAGARINSRLSDAAGGVTFGAGETWRRAAPASAYYFDSNAPAESAARPRGQPGNTESYAYQADNDFLGAAQNPQSTFAIDVDTASYSNVRRFLQDGRLPPHDAVRVEELVNYFPYSYPAPAAAPAGAAPFAASMEVAEAPWAPTHRLVRIGLKGREVATADRPAANLVFLLDVSGSMSAPNRLPLVKESMRLLVGKLRADDRVAIVTYAGQSGLALPSTPAAKSREILDALDALTPGGSTNGAMGIQLAYDVAKANFVKGGINRVILCTDGDFNVGVTSEGELVRLITEKAKSGVALTALGFGMGNYKDSMIEKLADHGDGNYGYIDTRREAEKLLVEQVNGTLMTIAKDVKIQVEFNPAKVASYRLIGYEDRLLKQEDFNNDQVDAGEIGAGHTVTALYEIVPVGAENNPAAGVPAVDALKYGAVKTPDAKSSAPSSAELLTLKLRYKQPDGDVSAKQEFPLTDAGGRFEHASADFKFAAAVAEFAMILRDSPHKGAATMGDVLAWAAAASARDEDDRGGYRGEFLDLARKAQALLR